MRGLRFRSLAAVAALLALLVLPPAASVAAPDVYVGLQGLSCEGVTAVATGLPPNTRVTLRVLDPATRRTIDQATATTSASGGLSLRLGVSLSGLAAVRVVVLRAGTDTPVAWAEQRAGRRCPLARTGPAPALPLAGLGTSCVALGLVLLSALAYQGRHLPGSARHLAGSGRHLARR